MGKTALGVEQAKVDQAEVAEAEESQKVAAEKQKQKKRVGTTAKAIEGSPAPAERAKRRAAPAADTAQPNQDIGMQADCCTQLPGDRQSRDMRDSRRGEPVRGAMLHDFPKAMLRNITTRLATSGCAHLRVAND